MARWHPQAVLSEIASALGPISGVFGPIQCRENGDDGDDDEQLNQGEAGRPKQRAIRVRRGVKPRGGMKFDQPKTPRPLGERLLLTTVHGPILCLSGRLLPADEIIRTPGIVNRARHKTRGGGAVLGNPSRAWPAGSAPVRVPQWHCYPSSAVAQLRRRDKARRRRR